MELSVIIVNYNVKHFLEQCLLSVLRATRDLKAEIFVVDNNSADGSCSMVRSRFPGVRLIRNDTNRGFSSANNQAIKESSGRYILLLNPDTVLPEDALTKSISFMESTPIAGAMGLRMIDGRGRYLPESKRGFPSPSAALLRMTGLSRLFSRSGYFNRYYLGNLDKSEVNEVDVLTGAYMLIRGDLLRELGGLDETFFMYGEDIDLSYRITTKGYRNYYLPDPAIIHYKGESTRKSDINYTYHFYRSMIIFVNKHLRGKGSGIFRFLIHFAVLLRAFISVVANVARRIIFPLAEAVLIYIILYFTARFWGVLRFDDSTYYPGLFTRVFEPIYALIWTAGLYLWGGYRKREELGSVPKGILTGTLILLAVYALLPDELRFSRAVIIIGTALIIPVSLLIRILFASMGYMDIKGFKKRPKRVIIVAGEDEFSRIRDILDRSHINYIISGRVTPIPDDDKPHLGSIENLLEAVRVNQPDEVIFSSEDIQAGVIIEAINSLSHLKIEKRIAQTGSAFVIGSKSPTRPGEIYSLKLTGEKRDFIDNII